MRTQASLRIRVFALALVGLTWSCTQEPTPTARAAPIPAPPEAPAPSPVAPVEPTPEPPIAQPPPTPTAAPEAPKPNAKSDVPKPIAEIKPEPAPAPAPKAAVRVPQSAHVRAEVPKAMQALLDADTRMQPWLDRTFQIIEGCYAEERAKNDQAAGTIVVAITMHANSRPDADLKTLPPQLSGVVACATGKLVRAPRMPLFSGPEGATHTARVTFSR